MATNQGSTTSGPQPGPDAIESIQARFPTAYTILFGLIVAVAALTWMVPSGKYDRQLNAALNKDVAVPGTYHSVDANPLGIVDVLLAPRFGNTVREHVKLSQKSSN